MISTGIGCFCGVHDPWSNQTVDRIIYRLHMSCISLAFYPIRRFTFLTDDSKQRHSNSPRPNLRQQHLKNIGLPLSATPCTSSRRKGVGVCIHEGVCRPVSITATLSSLAACVLVLVVATSSHVTPCRALAIAVQSLLGSIHTHF